MDDEELLRRLREHGRRLEREADRIGLPDAQAPEQHRRTAMFVASGLLTAAALAVVVLLVVPRVHSHQAVTVAPSTTGPSARVIYGRLPPRLGAAMAYDQARRDVVLFGGSDLSQTLGDTWLWDGHGWVDARPPAAPPARENAVMAYDPITKEVMLFGGTAEPDRHSTPVELHDTWTWSGTKWTQQRPLHQPPWSNGLAMSYDPRSHAILLLTLPSNHPDVGVTPDGGHFVRGPAAFGTWQWTGSDWRELSTPVAPLAATADDVLHGNPRLVALPHEAGLLLYSWAEWLGSCPPGIPFRAGSRCDFSDPNGTRFSQTWTWDGNHWTEQHPHRAPIAGELVASPGGDAAPVVFTPDGATWQWTGSDWRQSMSARPGPRGQGLAVYDDAVGEVVAYAGTATIHGQGPVTWSYDTWTWSGTWTRRDQPNAPATTTPPVTETSAPPAACNATQLTGNGGRVAENGGAHGDIELTNTGAVPCSLDIESASLSLVANGAQLPVQPAPPRSGLRIVLPRVLPSRGRVHVIVFWSNWCKPDPGPLQASLTLPHGGETLTVPFDGPPDNNFVPRCDVPNAPSTIEILGFAAP